LAARQRKTWLRRVLTSLAAMVVFSFIYLASSRQLNSMVLGRELFAILTGFGMVYSLLAGPLTTIDCLSRERREGTLGFLFLTDSHTYDIVLGKMASASLDVLFGLAGALPLIAVIFLIGGINLTQFAWAGVALFNIMFMSLAVGICASSFWASGRAALGATLLVLIFLTLGLPLLGEQVFQLQPGDRFGLWFYSLCPIYMISAQSLAMSSTQLSGWIRWLSMGGLQLLAWTCLLVACLRTRQSWRDLPANRLQILWTNWNEGFERWTRGSARRRQAWRRSMLDRNPVAWLEGRARLQTLILWGLVFIATTFWAAQHTAGDWPRGDTPILWALLAHYSLCLWIAIQAPRRFADDKQSGALELLVCTALNPQQMVSGTFRMMRRRFGWPFLAMMLLNAYMFLLLCEQQSWGSEELGLGLSALIVFPLQVYCFVRIGIYQGLSQTNSLLATFALIGKIGLLPWLLCFGFLLTWDQLHLYLGIASAVNDLVAYSTWIGAHVLVCGLFLAHANWHLRRHFRSLAATFSRPSWWRRRVKTI